MNKYLFTFLILLGIFIVIVGSVLYYRNENNTKTLAVLRVVHSSYDMKYIRDKDPGYLDGPDGLMSRLILSEGQFGTIKNLGDYKQEGGLIFDKWRNAIWVVRTSAGYRVCSRGRDGLPNTEDDLVVE